jgi:hypothetical protein
MLEDEEIHAQIIRDSEKKLLMVKTLSNFFNHKDLFAVFVRTKVIHNLFESNKALDVNKLDLFHVQYTSSLIDLFQKLKKAKEQQYLLISDEIYINDDLIKKLEKETEGRNFASASRRQAQDVSTKLKELYTLLSDNKPGLISWGDVLAFATRMGQEFYRETGEGQFAKLTSGEGRKTYESNNAVIERKLLGRLNILNFRIKFACGLSCNNHYAEVYEFVDSSDRFVFVNTTKAFYLLDDEVAKTIDLSKNLSNKGSIVMDLKLKTEQLKEKMATIKTSMPKDVENVLAAYLEKISGVDFLEELQNVDEQTNILRAMLNINITK